MAEANKFVCHLKQSVAVDWFLGNGNLKMDGSYARIQIGIRQMTCADSFSAAKKKEEEEEPKWSF